MIHVIDDFDLRVRNTFRISAKCRQWVEYTDAGDIPAVLDMIGENTPHFHIGAGSNLLICTDNYDGAVLHSSILTHEVTPVGADMVRVTVGAGLSLDSVCQWACESGLWGLENLSVIPGEVGSSVVQNVGAYGCEAADLIEYAEVYDTQERRPARLYNSDLCFGYRVSLLKQPEYKGRYIVTEVAYNLSTVHTPRLDYGNLSSHFADGRSVTPMAIREVVTQVRAAKLPDPADIGSAGSFFKNPVVSSEEWEKIQRKCVEMFGTETEMPHYPAADGKIKLSAAWLIDHANGKTMSCGGAAVWQKQPLVLINSTGKATYEDVLLLKDRIIDAVYGLFGVRLMPEVEIIKNINH